MLLVVAIFLLRLFGQAIMAPCVKAEMSLHVLAYNMKRAIKVLGAKKIINVLQPVGAPLKIP